MFKGIVKYTKFVLIPAVLIILLINVLVKDPSKENIDTYISKAIASRNYQVAKKEYKNLIDSDFNNLEYHRGYISAHYDMPRRNYSDSTGNDGELLRYYLNWLKSGDPNILDIARYCLGYINVSEDKYKEALEFYLKVENKSLKFLNNSIGYCYLELKDYDQAKTFFNREIELEGNMEGALRNYTKILLQEKNIKEMGNILKDEKYKDIIGPVRKSEFFFITRDFISYFHSILSVYRERVIIEGVIASLLICIIWFLFIKRLDIFEPEKFRFLFLTFLISVVISRLDLILYDFFELDLNFSLKGSALEKLAYCIFGIGLIEELVKILPVLIILFSTKQINESTDYIIYASVSALGFAFMENLGYFHEYGLRSIAGRALTCVILHVFLSSLAIYGLVYSKYKKKSIFYFAASFLVACTIHGLYDFPLITSGWPREFRRLSFVIFICSVVIYARIVTNVLNSSEFFKGIDYKSYLRNNGLILLYGLSYVLVVQYLIVALRFGPTFANNEPAFDVFSLVIIYFICLGLSRFELQKNQWYPLLEGKVKKRKRRRPENRCRRDGRL